MIWVALGAGAVGIIAVGANYDDSKYLEFSNPFEKRHSAWSEYHRYSEYGDSSILETIKEKEKSYDQLTSNIKENKEKIKQKLVKKIDKIKTEYKKNIVNFDINSAENISSEELEKLLNDELQKEVDKEVNKKKAELEQIDKIIAKIDEKILCN